MSSRARAQIRNGRGRKIAPRRDIVKSSKDGFDLAWVFRSVPFGLPVVASPRCWREAEGRRTSQSYASPCTWILMRAHLGIYELNHRIEHDFSSTIRSPQRWVLILFLYRTNSGLRLSYCFFCISSFFLPFYPSFLPSFYDRLKNILLSENIHVEANVLEAGLASESKNASKNAAWYCMQIDRLTRRRIVGTKH